MVSCQRKPPDPKSQMRDRDRLPNSQKVYVETNGLRIPFREISLTPSKAMDGTIEENPPVRVYDTSGPWTDPEQTHDVRDGLPAHRREWIIARGDVEESKSYAFTRESNAADAQHGFTPKGVTLTPLRSQVRPLRHPDALRPQRDHHAGDGVHRHA